MIYNLASKIGMQKIARCALLFIYLLILLRLQMWKEWVSLFGTLKYQFQGPCTAQSQFQQKISIKNISASQNCLMWQPWLSPQSKSKYKESKTTRFLLKGRIKVISFI